MAQRTGLTFTRARCCCMRALFQQHVCRNVLPVYSTVATLVSFINYAAATPPPKRARYYVTVTVRFFCARQSPVRGVPLFATLLRTFQFVPFTLPGCSFPPLALFSLCLRSNCNRTCNLPIEILTATSGGPQPARAFCMRTQMKQRQ